MTGVTADQLGIATRGSRPSLPEENELYLPQPLCSVDGVPVVRPSAAQFQDPMAFIERIRPYGEQYGGVKVVPPSSWTTECQFQDLSQLSFRTVTQALTHSTSNYDEKVRFYRDLVTFHQRTQPLVRLPSIDKRVVDLFKLRQSVEAKGGFSTVCQKKQWAQIGRELGYTGRTMTSLSTSLKVAYVRVIQDYDEYIKKKANGGPEAEPSEHTNADNKRPLRSNGEASLSQDADSTSSTPVTKDPSEPTTAELTSSPEIPRKKFKYPSKPQIKKSDVSYISNSRTVYRRSRDVLKSKGFRTNFESFTDEIEGITHPGPSTYESYDFNFWHEGLEVSDHPFPSSEYGRQIDFATFYEANLKNSHLIENTEDDLIAKFWTTLKEQNDFSVETSQNLPTAVYGSGFPTLSDLPTAKKEHITDPWNFHNLPLHENGILRYLSTDQELLTKPRLNVSSKYSVQSYNMEDHFLHHVDYHHMGAPKVWYFITPQDRARYEEVLSRCLKEYRGGLGTSDDSTSTVADPIAMDILEGIQQEDQFDVRASASNPLFDRFYEHKPSLIRFNADLLIQPNILKEHGITIHHAIQYPGEFIIKWPRCYSSTVSLGVSLTEAVPLAPKSWLSLGLEAEMWLWKQGLLPAFSYYQLLCNIVEESRDSDVLKKVQPHFDHFVLSETKLRSELKSLLGHQTKLIINKFDYICDDSLADSFPTKVVMKANEDTFIADPRRLLRGALRTQDMSGFKTEVHVYYSDDKLKSMQRTLAALSQTPADWLNKFNSMLDKDSLPSLKSLKTLHLESERICDEIQEAQVLAQYLAVANNWVDRAQELLNAKQKNRIRNRRQVKEENRDEDLVQERHYEFEVLENLIAEIPSLTFTCPEIDQVIELANEIQSFEISARSFLSESDRTEEEFVELIDLGKSFGVRLRSVELLDRVVNRWRWLRDCDDLMERKNYTLEEAKVFLEKGYDVCGSLDAEKLNSLRSKVIEGQKWSIKASRELSSDSLSIDSLTTLLGSTEGIPLESVVAEKLKDAKDKQIETLGVLSHISSQFSRSQNEQNSLKSMINMKKTQYFDKPLYEKLMKKYSGGDKDKRPSHSEVKELFEKSQEYAATGGPGQSFMEIHMELEAVESWQKMMKKIFGKVNAPVHLLKTHLETLNEKAMHAFAVSDKYDPNRREEDHLLFCFCRRAESGTMVACEKCDEWYHCRCLKFARGRSREVDNYICPLCDHRIEIPKEYNTPSLEELQHLLEIGSLLKLCPDELSLVYSIWTEAEAFREYLKEVLPWEGSDIVGNDIALFRFYLRKLEGASVLLADEYNQLRQLTWKLEPLGDEPPPIIVAGNKTKKKKKSKEVKDEPTADDSVGAAATPSVEPPAPVETTEATETNGTADRAIEIKQEDENTNGTTHEPQLVKIPIIQPLRSGLLESETPPAQYATMELTPVPSEPAPEPTADEMLRGQ